MVHIRILDGVSVDVGGERVTLHDDEVWLTVVLALVPAEGIAAEAVHGALGIEGGAAEVREYLSRFQGKTGLVVHSTDRPGSGYRIDRDGVTVDALRYLELADQVRHSPPGDRSSARYEARLIWRTGPPEFGMRPNPVAEAYERLHRAHAYVTGLRKRILIVDDQVGDLLAERLDRHECTVAHDLKEFNSLRGDLHEFDLAVVDLHLSTTYADATGDVIARDINAQGITLPVVMITLRPPLNRSVPEWIKSLGLVDVIFKERDEPGANMAVVAERVNALLLEDPVERACEQIANRVHSLRRKSSRRLAAQLSGGALVAAVETMEAHADKIARLAGELRLADARQEVERFVANWGE